MLLNFTKANLFFNIIAKGTIIPAFIFMKNFVRRSTRSTFIAAKSITLLAITVASYCLLRRLTFAGVSYSKVPG